MNISNLSFIIHQNLNNRKDRSFYAICDGHGTLGHLVSTFLKNMLPKKMESALNRDLECENDEFIKNCLNLVFL